MNLKLKALPCPRHSNPRLLTWREKLLLREFAGESHGLSARSNLTPVSVHRHTMGRVQPFSWQISIK